MLDGMKKGDLGELRNRSQEKLQRPLTAIQIWINILESMNQNCQLLFVCLKIHC